LPVSPEHVAPGDAGVAAVLCRAGQYPGRSATLLPYPDRQLHDRGVRHGTTHSRRPAEGSSPAADRLPAGLPPGYRCPAARLHVCAPARAGSDHRAGAGGRWRRGFFPAASPGHSRLGGDAGHREEGGAMKELNIMLLVLVTAFLLLGIGFSRRDKEWGV